MTLAGALLTLLAGCGKDAPEETASTGNTVSTSAETEPAEPERVVIIAADGTTVFNVVRGENCSPEVTAAASALVMQIKSIYSKYIGFTDDWERNPNRSDYEILVGKTVRETADTFIPDREMLGNGGYVIKMCGTKLFVAGGDDEGTVAAVDKLVSMMEKGKEFALPADFELYGCPSAFLSDLRIGGTSVSTMSIEKPSDPLALAGAEVLRREIFLASGILPGFSDGGGIRVECIPGESTSVSLTADGGAVVLSGSRRTGICRAVRDLFADIKDGKIPAAEGVCDIARWEKDYGKFVTYEDFGALGNGATDDTPAIVAAHNKANAEGLPVLAREDAVYYIGGSKNPAVIMTDTDWSTASFIIDDRDVESYQTDVFLVRSQYSTEKIDLSPLKAGQANVGYAPGYPALVTLYDSNVKQYIRQGANQDSGAAKTDVILVSADGTVDPSTPILWDFDTVTAAYAKRADDTPITIRGGLITTYANAGTASAYYARGIDITRSNVTVDGLRHFVEKEGADGQPYSGMLNFSSCSGCVIRDCVMTGHKTYKKIGSAGTSVSMGTYDILVTSCASFRAENCSQTNDINDSTYWGVFASNYAKNIVFDGCVFSRFDAHKGVCNVTLRGCTLGHQGINLIGHGQALIENCTVYSSYFVNLRSDYGSTWDGDLTIRNCRFLPKAGAGGDVVIINGSNDGTHDFGYVCTLPKHILIDGFYAKDSKSSSAPRIFADINKNYKTAPRQILMPESVTVGGFESVSGKTPVVAKDPAMFPGVSIVFE